MGPEPQIPSGFTDLKTCLKLTDIVHQIIDTRVQKQEVDYPQFKKEAKKKIQLFLNNPNYSLYYKWYVLHEVNNLESVEKKFFKENGGLWPQILMKNKTKHDKEWFLKIGRKLHATENQLLMIDKEIN